MMGFPNSETVEHIRRTYPVGCRVVLDQMDDVQAPRIGSQGTVTGVDDTGSVMCAWDEGGSLSVVYGADRCHKIATETEAKATLDWYGKHQPDADSRCPRCGEVMPGSKNRHALSRWAGIMVCDQCGTAEALEQAGMAPKKPLMQWTAITGPQSGGGRWRG